MISFGSNILNNLDAATSREWLETNGLGGFASSTIIGLNTRRYHGLLVAATKPPVGRVVLLSKLEETLIINGKRFDLSANQYPGVVDPRGFEFQTGFRLDPCPIFAYEVSGLHLEKSIFMVQGKNTTVIDYQLQGNILGAASLEIRPLVAFRDYHSTTHENDALNPSVETSERLTTIKPYGDLPALHFAHTKCELETKGFWYRRFQYAIERERGLDFEEDLFSPFLMRFDLFPQSRLRILSSTEDPTLLLDSKPAYGRSTGGDELIATLTTAADQFIVARGRGKTIIAGYHWFGDWGRDTMIALPGLMLTTKRYEEAKSVLLEFAKYVDKGMLPNRFPDAGETAEYNTVDATLWFFQAIRALLKHTNQYDFVRDSLFPVLKVIIDWHVRGTRYNIHVDHDGLLESGEPGVQLTWMDAKVGDLVITPRNGKPVEIQALWYNALRVMEHLAEKYDDPDHEMYGAMADKARQGFNQLFWNETASCLYDVVNGNERDASVRPNQVIALSLEYPLVSGDRARQVMEVIERELLTPRGLRTLSPQDLQYRGRYEGDGAHRDSVYHQGTVWPWLIGPYFSAYAKTFGKDQAKVVLSNWLADFRQHLLEACVGQVSEILDGDAPHAPKGCVAQAWSVAEILRAADEILV